MNRTNFSDRIAYTLKAKINEIDEIKIIIDLSMTPFGLNNLAMTVQFMTHEELQIFVGIYNRVNSSLVIN